MNAKFVAALAVVFAVVAGTAMAGPAAKKLLTGKDIKDGSIGIVDLSSATRVGLKGAKGPTGSSGPQGPAGPKGDTGAAGPAGVAGPQGLKGDTGAQGAPGLIGVWKGAYSSGTTYAKLDVVSFNGAAWISKSDANTAHNPGTTADWELVADKGAQGVQGLKGDKGDTGAQGQTGVIGAWKGAYSAATAYALNDVVSFGGSSYISKTAGNTNHTPGTGADWEVVASKGDAGAAGAKGDKGDKGDTGAQGAQGIQGPKGDTGAPGGVAGFELVAEPTGTVQGGTDPRLDTATCPAGKKALGGGIVATGGDPGDLNYKQYPQVLWSGPGDDEKSWQVEWYAAGNVTTEVRVICAIKAS
jgi:hypothetical protein